MLERDVPAVRGVTDAEVRPGGLVEAALGEEVATDLRLGRLQLRHEEGRCRRVRVEQALPLTALPVRRRPALLTAQLDADPAGEHLDRVGEVEMLDLPHERDRVAGRATAEALVEAERGIHGERRGLLVVEGAQPLQPAAAGVAQRDVVADDLLQRHALTDRSDVLVANPPGHGCLPSHQLPVVISGGRRLRTLYGGWPTTGGRSSDAAGSPGRR